MVRRLIAVMLAGGVAAAGCTAQNKEQANGQIDPNSPLINETVEPTIGFETFIAAARLAETRGQLPNAAQQYDKALQLRPGDAPTLRRLAVVQTQLGATELAVATWRKYLAVHEAPDAFGGLGYCLELAGKSQEAEATYATGLEKYPASELIRVNYGLLLARRGEPEAAVEQLKVVLKPAAVEYNLASVYEQQGKLSEAQAHYKAALLLDPTLSAAKQRLALIE